MWFKPEIHVAWSSDERLSLPNDISAMPKTIPPEHFVSSPRSSLERKPILHPLSLMLTSRPFRPAIVPPSRRSTVPHLTNLPCYQPTIAPPPCHVMSTRSHVSVSTIGSPTVATRTAKTTRTKAGVQRGVVDSCCM